MVRLLFHSLGLMLVAGVFLAILLHIATDGQASQSTAIICGALVGTGISIYVIAGHKPKE